MPKTVIDDCGGAVDMIPDKNEFPVNLAGIDGNNQIYIQIISKKHSDWWSKLRYMMGNLTLYSDPIPFENLELNMPVIVRQRKSSDSVVQSDSSVDNDQDNTDNIYNYYRARVVEVPSTPNQRVLVFKIDQFKLHQAKHEELFEISPHIASIPPFAVQCYLEGLEFFLGVDAFNWAQNLQEIIRPGDRRYSNYTATKVGKAPDGTHILKLVCNHGDQTEPLSLLHRIQIMIRDRCEMAIPKVGDIARVVLTHMDESTGYIWFQYEVQPLIDRIGQVLGHFRPSKDPQVDPAESLTPQENWKRSTCEGDAEVLLVKYRDHYYRAKRTRKLETENDTWEIEYIDYGNKEVKHDSYLFPARFYDENLCLVPEQCLKARFNSKLDLNALWELIETASVVQIEVLPFVKEGNNDVLNVKILPKQTKSSKGIVSISTSAEGSVFEATAKAECKVEPTALVHEATPEVISIAIGHDITPEVNPTRLVHETTSDTPEVKPTSVVHEDTPEVEPTLHVLETTRGEVEPTTLVQDYPATKEVTSADPTSLVNKVEMVDPVVTKPHEGVFICHVEYKVKQESPKSSSNDPKERFTINESTHDQFHNDDEDQESNETLSTLTEPEDFLPSDENLLEECPIASGIEPDKALQLESHESSSHIFTSPPSSSNKSTHHRKASKKYGRKVVMVDRQTSPVRSLRQEENGSLSVEHNGQVSSENTSSFSKGSRRSRKLMSLNKNKGFPLGQTIADFLSHFEHFISEDSGVAESCSGRFWNAQFMETLRNEDAGLDWLLKRYNKQTKSPPYMNIRNNGSSEPIGKLCDVFVHSSESKDVYIMTRINDLHSLKILEREMKEFYEDIGVHRTSMPYKDLIENNYYAAYHLLLDRWLRCKLLSKAYMRHNMKQVESGVESDKGSNKTLRVIFIDYGNSFEGDYNNVVILPMATKFLKLPQQGFRFQPTNDHASSVEINEENLLGKLFTIFLNCPEPQTKSEQSTNPLMTGTFLCPSALKVDQKEIDYFDNRNE